MKFAFCDSLNSLSELLYSGGIHLVSNIAGGKKHQITKQSYKTLQATEPLKVFLAKFINANITRMTTEDVAPYFLYSRVLMLFIKSKYTSRS